MDDEHNLGRLPIDIDHLMDKTADDALLQPCVKGQRRPRGKAMTFPLPDQQEPLH